MPCAGSGSVLENLVADPVTELADQPEDMHLGDAELLADPSYPPGG